MTSAAATSSPTISVALCTFNGEKFLAQQLQSLAGQTYPIAQLVVFDDNSSDATHQILAAFKANCSFPVVIHVNQQNLGVVGNFQKAIASCTGDLIALADQDDVWLPEKLATIVGHFAQAPDCGYVFSDAELIDEEDRDLGMTLWQSIGFDAIRQTAFRNKGQLQTLLRGGNFVYGTTLVFRSRFRAEVLPIASASLACTHDTWIALYLSATGRYGIALPLALVQYRQHASQLFGGGKKLNTFEKVKHLFQSRPDIDDAHVGALLALAERVRNVPAPASGADESASALTELALHLRARHRGLSRGRLARLGILLPEILSRRYGKYSSSAMSILKDLLLPARRAALQHHDGSSTKADAPSIRSKAP
jgi:hypothetical protein